MQLTMIYDADYHFHLLCGIHYINSAQVAHTHKIAFGGK